MYRVTREFISLRRDIEIEAISYTPWEWRARRMATTGAGWLPGFVTARLLNLLFIEGRYERVKSDRRLKELATRLRPPGTSDAMEFIYSCVYAAALWGLVVGIGGVLSVLALVVVLSPLLLVPVHFVLRAAGRNGLYSYRSGNGRYHFSVGLTRESFRRRQN